MSPITQAEEIALGLSVAERSQLIATLIDSLGSPFADQSREELISLADERSREMDGSEANVMSEDQFWSSLSGGDISTESLNRTL